MSAVRVVIADDHPRVPEGLRHAIEDEEGLALVGEAVDGRDLAAQLAEVRPDVVVTDLGMPHFDLPQQQIADWRATYPTMKILVHTAYKSAALARLLILAAADAVCGQTDPPGGWRAQTTDPFALSEKRRAPSHGVGGAGLRGYPRGRARGLAHGLQRPEPGQDRRDRGACPSRACIMGPA